MTNEEKKAIEKFKNFIYTYQDVIEDEYSDYEEKESAKEYQEVSEKILNIIKKQSKEIEELKELNNETVTQIYIRVSKDFKDKIMTKIEEYKEKCKNCNFKGKICKDLTKNYNCTIAMCLKEFYSLLEKE